MAGRASGTGIVTTVAYDSGGGIVVAVAGRKTVVAAEGHDSTWTDLVIVVAAADGYEVRWPAADALPRMALVIKADSRLQSVPTNCLQSGHLYGGSD